MPLLRPRLPFQSECNVVPSLSSIKMHKRSVSTLCLVSASRSTLSHRRRHQHTPWLVLQDCKEQELLALSILHISDVTKESQLAENTFAGLRVGLASLILSTAACKRSSCCFWSLPNTRTSSMSHRTPSSPDRISDIRLWKRSRVLDIPNGILLKQ